MIVRILQTIKFLKPLPLVKWIEKIDIHHTQLTLNRSRESYQTQLSRLSDVYILTFQGRYSWGLIKGLIRPRRTTGNQRVYTPRNKARLKLIIRGKRFGFSLDEIAEMIGMADADSNELNQIEKSLNYGDAKLKEIRERKKELMLLEQDILAIRDKLIKRKMELEITG